MRLLFFLVSMLLAAAPAFADLYQWTDMAGTVHITDSMEKVPQEYRAKVRIIKEEPKEGAPGLEMTTPKPLGAEPGNLLYGDNTLEWWRQSFIKKKNDINEMQSAISVKTQFMEVYEGGRRFGQVYAPEHVAQYNLYREELPEDLRKLTELRSEYEELQRRATIAGVPREIRE